MFNLAWFVFGILLVIGGGIYVFWMLNNDKLGKKIDDPGKPHSGAKA